MPRKAQAPPSRETDPAAAVGVVLEEEEVLEEVEVGGHPLLGGFLREAYEK
jgi:hypothetical protein